MFYADLKANEIRVLSIEEVSTALPLLQELRPHLNQESLLQIFTQAAKADQYQLTGVYVEEKLIAIMGHRILYDFVHGKHLYIDDLVTTSKVRSKGAGKMLMDYAESLAKIDQCSGIRLCTAKNNTLGQKFYERCGMQSKVIVYKKKI